MPHKHFFFKKSICFVKFHILDIILFFLLRKYAILNIFYYVNYNASKFSLAIIISINFNVRRIKTLKFVFNWRV